MTKQEAIITLKIVDENASCDECLYYNQMEDCPSDEDCIIRQALEMAIDVLETVNKIECISKVESVEDLKGMGSEETILALFKTVLNQTVAEDCVSRREVIEMATMANNGSVYFGYPTLAQFIDYIKRLPSVKTERDKEKEE